MCIPTNPTTRSGQGDQQLWECRRVCPPRVEVVGLGRPVVDLSVFSVHQQRRWRGARAVDRSRAPSQRDPPLPSRVPSAS